MNSNATAGVSRARPRTCVCWVATVASCHLRKFDEGLPSGRHRGWTAGSQFAAHREEIAAGIDGAVLLDVAGALHFTLRCRLCGRERRIDGRRAGQCGRKLLADAGADALEFGYRRVL